MQLTDTLIHIYMVAAAFWRPSPAVYSEVQGQSQKRRVKLTHMAAWQVSGKSLRGDSVLSGLCIFLCIAAITRLDEV